MVGPARQRRRPPPRRRSRRGRTDKSQRRRRAQRIELFPPRLRRLPAWGPRAREPDTGRALSRGLGVSGLSCPPPESYVTGATVNHRPLPCQLCPSLGGRAVVSVLLRAVVGWCVAPLLSLLLSESASLACC